MHDKFDIKIFRNLPSQLDFKDLIYSDFKVLGNRKKGFTYYIKNKKVTSYTYRIYLGVLTVSPKACKAIESIFPRYTNEFKYTRKSNA